MSTTLIGACLAVIALHFYLRNEPRTVRTKRGTIIAAVVVTFVAAFGGLLVFRAIADDDLAMRVSARRALWHAAIPLCLWGVLLFAFPRKEGAK